ncbi:cytochrome c [Achromobacter mucicolens]|jgi:mono/diheme cytochrome c family protein|uniref:SorU family sulfite dehydrogenase c-type cytochrome subunit n=1 Tax=Achromobacter TaxID=222 RepID=UPI0009E95B1F|nr:MULTISPECIES: cytochrome c [Achromobacter]MDF2860991.1 cytochrome [Achromobacter mucicolens]TQJ98096.1 mono/diheme cytochrome c family protein [Achromobacter sp. SLBN-14]
MHNSQVKQHAATRRPIGWRASFALAAGVWLLTGAKAWAAEPPNAEAGRALFLKATTPACAVCHTLADAGAAGTIGPNLDELKPDANRVTQAVRNGIGVMPAFDALSDEQVQALAKYVSGVTGAQ